MYFAEKELDSNIIHKKNNVEFYKEYYSYYQQSIKDNIHRLTLKFNAMYLLTQNCMERNGICKHSENFLQLCEMSFETLLFLRLFGADTFKDGIEDIERPFNIWKFHYRSLLIIDIFCWIALQTVTKFITANYPYDKQRAIERVCDKLDDIFPKVEPVKCSNNIFMTYAEFRLFAIFRTHFLEEIDVLKQLSETHKNLQCPQKEYSLLDENGHCKNILEEERINIYLEGELKGKRAFKTNFENCQKFLKLYKSATQRNLPSNDITLKAIYRELFLDGSVRHRKQSKTIINAFLKNKKFNNYAEYYFINEKINWGIYREYGLLDEFRLKNKFHEKLYILVNRLLTRLKPKDIRREACVLFGAIFSILGDVLFNDEISLSVKAMDDFLSNYFFLPLDPSLKPPF